MNDTVPSEATPTEANPTTPTPLLTPPLAPPLAHAEELQHTVSGFLVPLRVTAPPRPPFHATVASAGDAALHAGRLRSTPHSVLRTPGLISSSDPDLFKVTLHLSGTAHAEQGDGQHRAHPGDLLALDTTHPYALHLPDPCDVVVIGLPRGLLGPYARTLARRSGIPIPSDTGTAALCAALLTALGDQVDTLSGNRSAYVLDAVTGLLISTLTDIPGERVETPAAAFVDRIVLHTLARLRDPDLCAESVAAHHRISVRRLHQLFQSRDRTFTAWLRHERLVRIHRDLSDPALSHRTATSIAADWGLLDGAHLSRALREEFGCTAAELRRFALPETGRPQPVSASTRARGEATSSSSATTASGRTE
ncbi:helix-turn-helix domain-containing protein [Streptomyces sp. NBC_00237]|uniref:AraC-like ligand-binding domain-containing protein n=1 Tax=Streptomyces sp. NBC_00237 TaxID=2975687 RepID=UPI002256ED24|nr:helix-turn-helix domain-containing protein [Streptomyces sp. NBC_00237]MCX5202843.1 helix-turn-helix domain-containing protein [Streptomyces sp. NBC_00237]